MSEASEVYLRLKAVFGGRTTSMRARIRRAAEAELERDADAEPSLPFGAGRDPVGAGEALDAVVRSFAWEAPLARAALLAAWPELVGPETAAHAEALHVDEGVLVVQCDSTAWTTQLRAMRGELVTRLATEHPAAGIESIRFLNPGAPSWRHGPRSVPGRGPRDTYG